MTGSERVFLDTAPIIYLLDGQSAYTGKVEQIMRDLIDGGAQLETSVITCEEYLVHPYRLGKREQARAFRDFLADCRIRVLPITDEVADRAARIRADYSGFKAMDALQLAAASVSGCGLFLTNDKQLRQFTELRCITPDEWDDP